jgi:hypothetical protein
MAKLRGSRVRKSRETYSTREEAWAAGKDALAAGYRRILRTRIDRYTGSVRYRWEHYIEE